MKRGRRQIHRLLRRKKRRHDDTASIERKKRVNFTTELKKKTDMVYCLCYS